VDLRKSFHYALDRETAFVFLEYLNVPLDTNHLEREIRAIAMGRKAWLFCWTEVGARYVGIVQSLIASCRLRKIDPYVYLVDVLQRIDTHPVFPFPHTPPLEAALRGESVALRPQSLSSITLSDDCFHKSSTIIRRG
jgi:hypothetical protein